MPYVIKIDNLQYEHDTYFESVSIEEVEEKHGPVIYTSIKTIDQIELATHFDTEEEAQTQCDKLLELTATWEHIRGMVVEEYIPEEPKSAENDEEIDAEKPQVSEAL